MHASVEDWPENRIGIRLSVTPEEIDGLLNNLSVLRHDSGQHFHISADGPDVGRLGDIEISVKPSALQDNMGMTSIAYYPGDEIPLPTPRARWSFGSIRSGITALSGAIGIIELFAAAGSAYVTFATADYRPILIRGVLDSAVALLAFHACGLLARSGRARATAFAAALIALIPLAEILRRLAVVR